MRNLLEEFRGNHGIRYPTILGVREHVFTGRLFFEYSQLFYQLLTCLYLSVSTCSILFCYSVSSLASFMSKQETSFVTLGQRVLAYLK